MNWMIPDDSHGKIRRLLQNKSSTNWNDIYIYVLCEIMKLFSFWICKILKYEEQKQNGILLSYFWKISLKHGRIKELSVCSDIG